MSTLHDNNFDLKMIGLSDFNFTVTDYFITKEQPWDGISTSSNQKGAMITAKAGRKGSKETADWFKKNIINGSAIGCQTIDKLPSKLNFAFKGTMSFSHNGNSYIGKDIVIGQGHTAAFRNNWWIGGTNMSTLTDLPVGILSIIAQNFNQGKFLKAKVTFTISVGDVSSMGLNTISI
ncbi:hypothetical protein CXF68_18320 [Tenacibaculum sp. Bg11-29]|uniref:hypothetical protein n=1 Tax=Tenacibaculum sp. Bg11-29 TaxID=2058306 RepID=UPI000C34E235|nr:hypothetical protein [Tenacibaculum sp. Bg11-29]PKH52532.1 hypothetical protein CXF68_18320 [Tenacibaculum sp. Bg11-29]